MAQGTVGLAIFLYSQPQMGQLKLKFHSRICLKKEAVGDTPTTGLATWLIAVAKGSLSVLIEHICSGLGWAEWKRIRIPVSPEWNAVLCLGGVRPPYVNIKCFFLFWEWNPGPQVH